jgi:hypothetical protein
MVRRKKRKRQVRERAIEPRLTGPNQEWAMDFIVDGLATCHRQLKIPQFWALEDSPGRAG